MNEMNIEEYNKVKDYTYEKYCNYLKKKYGKSMYPYFMTNLYCFFQDLVTILLGLLPCLLTSPLNP